MEQPEQIHLALCCLPKNAVKEQEDQLVQVVLVLLLMQTQKLYLVSYSE
jgi:hypothetical protein